MTVSLTMIVRNEEADLPGCLASCSDLFDEIVIVDTGSTDRTKEVAAAHVDKHGGPARVFDFAWSDDFAKARNESVRLSTGDWIFWMDADDRIPAESAGRISRLIESATEPTLYLMETFSSMRTPKGDITRYCDHHVRLAPRRFCRWVRRLHEHIEMGHGVFVEAVGIAIEHVGYLDSSMEHRQARNLHIASRWLAEEPSENWALFAVARSLVDCNRISEAFERYGELFGRVTRYTNPTLWAQAMERCCRQAAPFERWDMYDLCLAELELHEPLSMRFIVPQLRLLDTRRRTPT